MCFLCREQPREFHVIEAEQFEVVVAFVEDRQFGAEEFLIPSGVQCKLVVSDDECTALRFVEMRQDDHGYFVQPELERRE